MAKALVAKSYENLEQITEPYELNGKMYVKVRTKTGAAKQVRAYSEAEYRKYNPEVKIIQPAKSRRNVLGFGDAGFIWLFKGDTYSVIDWFRASPCRYAKTWGWYLPSDVSMPDTLPAGIEPVKLMWDEVSVDEQLKSDADIQAIANSKIYDAGTSQWIGEIGDRITFTAVCERAIETMSMYGTSIIHTFKDEDGNVYVWATTAKSLTPGNLYELAGTIKQHSTYRNVKQNVMTRCSVKNDYGRYEHEE